jgi:hypothetical protein
MYKFIKVQVEIEQTGTFEDSEKFGGMESFELRLCRHLKQII